MPSLVLSSIASGISEAVGRAATINYTDDPRLVDSKYASDPIFSVFGALDLTCIIKIVLSLIAILFPYDAIVGEKERGTQVGVVISLKRLVNDRMSGISFIYFRF